MTKLNRTPIRGTKTSSYGTSKRESHDSTSFYNSKLYHSRPELELNEEATEIENSIPPRVLDKILCQDSTDMNNIPDSSLHLMVTSPPYNVGKEYDEDLSLDDYFEMLKAVLESRNTYSLLQTG